MTQVDDLSRIAKLVGQRVEELKGVKSQKDIAERATYKNQNMITMIKQGSSKVALDKAPDLARALEVDPKEFMLLALEQFYSPKVVKRILDDLGVSRDK